MDKQKKKKLIVLLLAIGCLISGFIYISADQYSQNRLGGLASADSLIQRVITDFGISDEQVSVSKTRVDSAFYRKTYYVGVPFQFSKTQLHATLNKRFYPYRVQTPAKVKFPEKDMDIQLLYKSTVIRTVKVQTDADLAYSKNHISLLVVFDELPGTSIINQLKKLGEPIPIVVKVTNPMQANRWRQQIVPRYNRIIYWLQNKDGKDLISTDYAEALEKLNQLNNTLANPTMLLHLSDEESPETTELTKRTKLSFVDASDALMLHKRMGKASFYQNLTQLQLNDTPSVALISGSTKTLQWLNDKIPALKKTGAKIIVPPQLKNR